MKILISNDDGFNSVGIGLLAQELAKDNEVVIFAPDENKSAASSSLSISAKLRPKQVKTNIYKVNGTPSDCVHLATRGFFDFEFDLVVAGVNFGANMGDDVIYSGTVACAIEARFLGLPAIAFSLATDIMTPHNLDNANNHHFITAAKVARQIVKNINKINIARGTILNVNVPDKPYDEIVGFQTTRLGKRHQSSEIRVCSVDNNDYYLGMNGLEDDNSLGTDFYAINNNFVSITPLHIDLTRYSEIDSVALWTNNLTFGEENG
jgi:5'-nucleotidase